MFYQGVLNFESKNISVASDQLDRAYEQNPYNIHVINAKGLSCMMKKEKVLAKQYFQKALDICPDFDAARENLERIQ